MAKDGNVQHVFNESNGLHCDMSNVTLTLSEYMLPHNSHYHGSIVVFKKNINITISKLLNLILGL